MMAGIDGQQPHDRGCDRCRRSRRILVRDLAFGALQLSINLAESGHDDAMAIAIASVLVTRLAAELVTHRRQSGR